VAVIVTLLNWPKRISHAFLTPSQPTTTTVLSGPMKVACLAYVTNTMGQTDRDFEKGEADGTADALMILETIAKAMRLR
jgi:hypothetical protein